MLLDRLDVKLQAQNRTQKTPSPLRQENLEKLANLYEELNLSEKHPNFTTIFDYTAINVAGIGLKEENFGEIQEDKYVQIISITHELNNSGKRISKNSSLGYYGKAEKITVETKNCIIEFILRWRYEKSFQHSDYYEKLLATIS
jgi:hypothetical protein